MTLTNPYSKFIPGEEIRDFASWRFDEVGDKSRLKTMPEPKPETPAEDDQTLAEKYRQQGFAEGFVQASAQAKLEAQREINDFISQQGAASAQEMAAMISALRERLTLIEQGAAQQVLLLACELTRQILRREVQVPAKAMLPVIQEALAEVLVESKVKRLRVNPLDMTHLYEPLSHALADTPVTLVPDAAIDRGGFVLEAAQVTVDGTMEGRWQRAIGSLGLSLPWPRESYED